LPGAIEDIPEPEKPEGSEKKLESKVTFNFHETDIKDVFSILGDISGNDFILDKNVIGKITLVMADPLPWNQGLDMILKMKQLSKSVEGNVIKISYLPSTKAK